MNGVMCKPELLFPVYSPVQTRSLRRTHTRSLAEMACKRQRTRGPGLHWPTKPQKYTNGIRNKRVNT